MSIEELLGTQDLETCQIIQNRQRCSHVILAHKVCQVISWGIATRAIW